MAGPEVFVKVQGGRLLDESRVQAFVGQVLLNFGAKLTPAAEDGSLQHHPRTVEDVFGALTPKELAWTFTSVHDDALQELEVEGIHFAGMMYRVMVRPKQPAPPVCAGTIVAKVLEGGGLLEDLASPQEVADKLSIERDMEITVVLGAAPYTFEARSAEDAEKLVREATLRYNKSGTRHRIGFAHVPKETANPDLVATMRLAQLKAEAQADSDLVAAVRLAKPKAEFLRRAGRIDRIEARVTALDVNFVLTVSRPKAVGNAKQEDFARLALASREDDACPVVRPPADVVAAAKDALEQALVEVAMDPIMEVPGVTSAQLRRNTTLQDLAAEKNVFTFFPARVHPAPAGKGLSGPSGSPGPPTLELRGQYQLFVTSSLDDQQVVEACRRSHVHIFPKLLRGAAGQAHIVTIDKGRHANDLASARATLLQMKGPLKFSCAPPDGEACEEQDCRVWIQLRHPCNWTAADVEALKSKYNVVFEAQAHSTKYDSYASRFMICEPSMQAKILAIQEPNVMLKRMTVHPGQHASLAPLGIGSSAKPAGGASAHVILVYFGDNAQGRDEVRDYILDCLAIETASVDVCDGRPTKELLLRRRWRGLSMSGIHQATWPPAPCAPIRLTGTIAAVKEATELLLAEAAQVEVVPLQILPAAKHFKHFHSCVHQELRELIRQAGKGLASPARSGASGSPEDQMVKDGESDDESDDESDAASVAGTNAGSALRHPRHCDIAFQIDNKSSAGFLAYFLENEDRAKEVQNSVEAFAREYVEREWRPPSRGDCRQEALSAFAGPGFPEQLCKQWDLSCVRNLWQARQRAPGLGGACFHGPQRQEGQQWRDGLSRQPIGEPAGPASWQQPHGCPPSPEVGFLLCGTKDQVQEVVAHLNREIAVGEQMLHHIDADPITTTLLTNVAKHSWVLPNMQRMLHAEFSMRDIKVQAVKKGQLCILRITGPKDDPALQQAVSRANHMVRQFRQGIAELVIATSKGEEDFLLEGEGAGGLKFLQEEGCLVQRARGQGRRDADSGCACRITGSASLPGGCRVEVGHGDLVKGGLGIAAIVNSANAELRHAGGIAFAIATAAGAGLHVESQRIVELRGGKPLAVADVVRTGPYGLASAGFDHVLHAVPPNDHRALSARAQMAATVRQVLVTASELGISSVAMPVFGVGIYNWPVAVALGGMFTGVSQWSSSASGQASSLRRIVIGDVKPETARAVLQKLREVCDGGAEPLQHNEPPPPSVPEHAWLHDDSSAGKGWVPYDYDQVLQLDRALRDGVQRVVLSGDINKVPSDSVNVMEGCKHATYEVDLTRSGSDFCAMQINQKSAFERRVQRAKLVSLMDAFEKVPSFKEQYERAVGLHAAWEQSAAAAPVASPQGPRMAFTWLPLPKAVGASGVHGLAVWGPALPLATAKTRIREVLAAALCRSQKPISLKAVAGSMASKLAALRSHVALGSHDVVIEADPDDGEVVLLRALGSTRLHSAELDVRGWVHARLQEALEIALDEARVVPPEYWAPNSLESRSVDFVELSPFADAAEYAHVVQRMRDAIGPNIEQGLRGSVIRVKDSWVKRIVKVERVVNPVSWKAYYGKRKLIEQLPRNQREAGEGGDANELWVKHGTGNTDPKEVCSCEAGLDFRYCKSGMFGRGTYTAEDARYSDDRGYRHTTQDGHGQLLLCRIAAGTIKQMDYDARVTQKLVKPPNGYDSVRGDVVPGTGAFAVMVYQTDQTYPAYLVSYVP